ncbi:MAG TPA: hypothetical protein VGC41_20950 [Kofleriaceae bacterium]
MALASCARGGVGQQVAQDDGRVVDGTESADAPAGHEFQDAHVYLDAKVYEDAKEYMDAKVYMDAHVFMDACVPTQKELLVNGNFDAGATTWHEVQYDGEMIRTDLPQAGTYGAWMGGYGDLDFGEHAVDEIFQDVAVPAGTTALTLTGYYEVGTQESSGTSTAFDTSSISLVKPAGETAIETGLAVSNVSHNTAYAPFTHSFAVAGVAGTTVRVKLTSSNDYSNNTNFFYDTLSLQATYCP